MKRFNNKYRIPSARLPGYDYSNPGDYFITICTAGKMKCFGRINNQEMILNDMGILVENRISQISLQFPEATVLTNIIMPDHIHFIIRIKIKINNELLNNNSPVETRFIASTQSESNNQSESPEASDSIKNGGITGIHNPMLKNGIPKIVRWFKGKTTYELKKLDLEFAWQTRYYDRIIRNKEEYFAIMKYIKSNPEKWDNSM